MSKGKGITVSLSPIFSLTTILFFIFLVLKLGVGNTEVVNWSWWLVALPLWGPWAIVLGIVAFIAMGWGFMCLIDYVIRKFKDRRRRKQADAYNKAIEKKS